MLIQCPECNHNVSDKALSCPSCGFPINTGNPAPAVVKSNTGHSRRKFRRLPNGFGSIKCLKGNRRNPYAAFPPTKEWKNNSPVSHKAIGYFPTYNEAYAALVEYNKAPYDTDNPEVTFCNVFEGFYAMKSETVGAESLSSYRTARRYFQTLEERPFKDIKLPQLQEIMDGIPYGYATSDKCKGLLVAMYKYAISHDIVTVNYGSSLIIRKDNDIRHGVPFTEKELAKLWELRHDPDGKVINIMLYTGLRVGELQGYHYKDGIITGGIKSRAGRDRIVPVIDAIRPLVESFDNFNFKMRTFRNEEHVYRVFNDAGCLWAATGDKHTSHDCRHTFSWLADKVGMDEVSKHMIMGHSLGPDVERNTYGHRTVEELTAEMNKLASVLPF